MWFTTIWLLFACDDTIFGPGEEGTVEGEGFCAVQQLVARDCASCHSGSAPSGGLDLSGDIHEAMVDVESPTYGQVLVVPGDHANSLFWLKMDDGSMPPGSPVDSEILELVATWIDDGADDVCETEVTTTRYHPDDWALPEVHGLGAKLQTETDCRSCHGDELQGARGPSCVSCHGEGWDTNCAFCHGTPEPYMAAPPEDIDDNDDPATISFTAHRAHAEPTDLHTKFLCDQCHPEPEDVLTPGHLFDDDTPGVAEIDFTHGLSPEASYDNGSCSNVYCHGDGQGPNGEMTDGDPSPGCGDCHPSQDASDADRWSDMSDEHDKHLESGFTCAACHPSAEASGDALVRPRVHVDGEVYVDPSAEGITWSGGTCTGVCHSEKHTSRAWD